MKRLLSSERKALARGQSSSSSASRNPAQEEAKSIVEKLAAGESKQQAEKSLSKFLKDIVPGSSKAHAPKEADEESDGTSDDDSSDMSPLDLKRRGSSDDDKRKIIEAYNKSYNSSKILIDN